MAPILLCLGGSNEVESVFLILFVVALLAYIISSVFMGVYDLSIDTILLCFCEDRDKNDGNEKPYYMSKELQKIINVQNKKAEVEASLREAEKEAYAVHSKENAVQPEVANPAAGSTPGKNVATEVL